MLTTTLLILSLVCFIAAASGFHAPQTGWLGLAFWVLTVVIGHG